MVSSLCLPPKIISDGPEGIILESVLEGYAEYYSADLSEKVIRGMTENALKGNLYGGTIPFGYTIDETPHYQPTRCCSVCGADVSRSSRRSDDDRPAGLVKGAQHQE